MRSRKLPAAESARKANGVYYTPDSLVDHVVAHTLRPLLEGKTPEEAARLRILDPSCGRGAFLGGVQRWLVAWHEEWHATHEPRRGVPPDLARTINRQNLYGVDLDAVAVADARQALPGLAEHVQAGNALLGPECHGGFDWSTAFPDVEGEGSFDAVLGNPPWGQKDIVKDDGVKRYLWQRFPSSAGIFDLFRPFVELGVRLTRPGGRFGMVLPDVVLLKDYPQTRLFLLDHLALERIDWWGQAFAGAMIDVTTIVGTRMPPGADQRVAVAVHDQDAPLCHVIAQADFRANPRHTFNLRLTAEHREVIEQLADCPRLGDFFEVHEGVHSGNIRSELFVAEASDDTCRPLYFGRDEIAPYVLNWRGKHIRLAAIPERKTRQRYASAGRPEWHQREKILVRRTGDHVLAAVDRQRYHASNNFFLVFPAQSCSLDLDGLCALLNSQFMTWYFRTVEPRQGRAFAELKIKHLSSFPLPKQVRQPQGCAALNELGALRARHQRLDEVIEVEVRRLLGVSDRMTP